MKRLPTARFLTMLMIAIIAIMPILARAQAVPVGPTPSTLATALDHLGGTLVYDPAAKKPIAALSYEVSKLTGVLGSKIDLSLSGLIGAGDGGAALGFGALYTRDIKLTLAKELKGVVSLTAGPAVLYSTNGGKMRLGGVVGIAFKF